MRATLQKIDDGFCHICSFIVATAIFGLIVLNFTQLVTRYIVDFTFTWAEEVSTLTIIYATAFGAAWVTLKRRHLKMDAATKILPQSVKNIAHWVAHVLIFVTGILYIVIGIEHSIRIIKLNNRSEMKSEDTKIKLFSIFTIR